MLSKQVVIFDSDEQRETRDLLAQLALAFPDRDDEGSEDAVRWRLLKRLSQHDGQFDADLLASIGHVLEVAADRLAERSAESFWLPVGAGKAPIAVPGSAPPSAVLAESARSGLVCLERLRQLVVQAAALAA